MSEVIPMFLDFLFGKKKEGAASPSPAHAGARGREKGADEASPAGDAGVCERARILSASAASVSKKIGALGRERFENALLLREEALRLISEFEELLDRKKKAEYGAVATRIKFSRKAQNAGRELSRFAGRVVSLFDEGKLAEQDGKIFGKVHELLRSAKPAEAKAELGKLDGFLRLRNEEEEARGAMAEFREELLSELAATNLSLEAIREYESFGAVDEAAARKYSLLQEKLGEYEKWRAERIGWLKEKPLLSLLQDDALAQLGFPQPQDTEKLRELMEFVKSEQALAPLPASGLLEMDGRSDERLAHTVPQVSKFRRLIRENSAFLWAVKDLGRTGFLRAASPEQARRIRAHLEKEKIPCPEAISGLAALGEGELAKMKAEAEKLRAREELKQAAQPENKETLLRRKSELEEALTLLG